MNYIIGFISANWAFILLAAAMLILIKTTVHLTEKVAMQMLMILTVVTVLTFTEFIEVELGNAPDYTVWRSILSGFKYLLPAVILVLISRVVFNETRWQLVIPAAVNAVICLLSIGTGWVFYIHPDNTFSRGPVWFIPFAVDAFYIIYLIAHMFFKSQKHFEDTAPLAFLLVTAILSVILPLIWGIGFEQWLCTTIMIDIFVYYVYLLQQLTKKDALTGLLNRQSYYSDIEKHKEDITAVVSLDMNGLKAANDTKGHDEGDKALITLANCFSKSAKIGQRVYRVGGDEFMILCTKTNDAEAEKLVGKIRKAVSATPYSCSVGYYVRVLGEPVEKMIKVSDERMYEEKAEYYRNKEKR